MAKDTYFRKLKEDKTEVKCFLANKTLITGRITNFDDECIIIDKCLIFYEQIISIVPA